MAKTPRQASTKKTIVTEVNDTSLLADAAAGTAADEEVIIDDTPATVEPANVSRCGGALREMREAQSLSIRDVVNQLRLSSAQVEALEADDYASLPEPMIVKGFIRNYAKCLKTSATPLLDAYNVIVPDAKRHSLILESTANMKFSQPKKMQLKHYILITLVAILATGTWYFYQNYIQKPNPILAGDTLSERITKALPQIAMQALERSEIEVPLMLEENFNVRPSSDDTVTMQNQTASATTEVATNVIDDVNEMATGAVDQNNVAALGNASIEQKPLQNGKSRLELDVTQETWVSIVNASGQEIYNKTLFAGNHEMVDVWPPVNLVVGNPHGTTLRINGEIINTAPYTRTNVARVPIN